MSGSFNYGNPDNGATILTGRTTCMRVQGHDAIVAGFVTSGFIAAGTQFTIMFQDNGTAGSAARDRVTAVFLRDPATDPPFDCSQLASNGFGSGYFTLTGDVAVEDH